MFCVKQNLFLSKRAGKQYFDTLCNNDCKLRILKKRVALQLTLTINHLLEKFL